MHFLLRVMTKKRQKMADKLTVNESLSVVSDPLRLHELYSPWNSPGQNTGVDSLSLLWGIFLTQVKPRSPALQADSLPVELPGKPHKSTVLLLLLLSHFSRVRLCATPQTATHQAGVGGHFLLQCMKVKSEKSRSVLSDSSGPHRLQPTRLLCLWDFPGKSTGVGCHCFLQ